MCSSPAAPASSARTSASGSSRPVTTCSASTTTTPGARRTSPTCVRNPRFEVLRHDVTVPAARRGRRDLQPRLPGLPGALPAQPGEDDEDLGPRRDQHARSRQPARRADPAGLDRRGLRRPRGAPADRVVLGSRQPDRPPLQPRRGQALRRDALLRFPPPDEAADQGRADLQHLRPAHAPRRRPRGLQLHRAGPARRRHHRLRRRHPDAQLLLRGRHGRRPDPPDGQPGRPDRPGEPRQPRRVHHPGAGATG